MSLIYSEVETVTEPFTVHWTPNEVGGLDIGVGEENPYYDHWVHLIVVRQQYD